MFRVIKRYYGMGIYSNNNVGMFVKSGALSESQYLEITGELYRVV